MTLSPTLLNALRRSRFRLRHANANHGVGERRSTERGTGMEFADYREYQPGDDIRKLDIHLLGRLGQHYVREYVAERQTTVSIAIDASASMNFGSPSKFEFARQLASALTYIGLAGGDAVQIIACRGGEIMRSAQLQGVDRAPLLFRWINGLTCQGAGFAEMLPKLEQGLPPRGLIFLLSDFWVAEASLAEVRMGRSRQEYVGVQILSSEEINPASLGDGERRLIDVESGEEIDVVIDQQGCDDYVAALAQWQDRLRSKFTSATGRFIETTSSADLESLLLSDFRKLGLHS